MSVSVVGSPRPRPEPMALEALEKNSPRKKPRCLRNEAFDLANLEVSNALLDVLAATLVQSRMQRDLTDSSMQRNIGTAFGHSLLALDNASRGLAGLDAVPAAMAADLETNWEVLGEPIQSAMRALGAQGVPGMENPYERLKDLTRGHRIDGEDLAAFVRGLGLPTDVEERMLALTPQTYVGLAPELVARHL